MQTVTGCKINVAQPSGADFEREIGLVGNRIAIDHAKRAIMEKVQAVVSDPISCLRDTADPKQEEKNRSGGGGGGRPPQREQYNQYSQPEQQYQPQGGPPAGGGYGQPQPQSQYPQQQQQAGPQGGAPLPGQEDPYSAYGGYQAYAAMWYAAMQQQQQGQPGPGPPPA